MSANGHIPATPSWWFDKFHDLPVWRPRSILPKHDGDIALLHHLRREILRTPAFARIPAPDELWLQTARATGIQPGLLLNTWPADDALALLQEWGRERIARRAQ